jgi:hypothetical protein
LKYIEKRNSKPHESSEQPKRAGKVIDLSRVFLKKKK